MRTEKIRDIVKLKLYRSIFFDKILSCMVVGSFSKDRNLYCSDEIDLMLVVKSLDKNLLTKIESWVKALCRENSSRERGWVYTLRNGPYKRKAKKPTLQIQLMIDMLAGLKNYPHNFLLSFRKNHKILVGKYLYPGGRKVSLKDYYEQKRNLRWWIKILNKGQIFFFEWTTRGKKLTYKYIIKKVNPDELIQAGLGIAKKETANAKLSGYKIIPSVKRELSNLTKLELDYKNCKPIKDTGTVRDEIITYMKILNKSVRAQIHAK